MGKDSTDSGIFNRPASMYLALIGATLPSESFSFARISSVQYLMYVQRMRLSVKVPPMSSRISYRTIRYNQHYSNITILYNHPTHGIIFSSSFSSVAAPAAAVASSPHPPFPPAAVSSPSVALDPPSNRPVVCLGPSLVPVRHLQSPRAGVLVLFAPRRLLAIARDAHSQCRTHVARA